MANEGVNFRFAAAFKVRCWQGHSENGICFEGHSSL